MFLKIGKIKNINLLILYLLISSLACSDKLSNDVVERIANKKFKKTQQYTLVKLDTIKLVFDVSESMKGFANTGTFQELIRKTKAALGPLANVNYYCLDNNISQVSDCLQFFNASLFNRREADFHRACELKKHNTKDLLIIITDFQFNDDKRYMDLVDTFQRKLLEGCYIKIFSTKPDFNGTIFPQFTNSARFHYSGKRPLYAIVIGEREQAKFIEQILRRAMPWENSITLSSETPLQSKILRSNASVSSDYSNLGIGSKDSLYFIYKIIGPSIFEWENWTKDEIQSEVYEYKDSDLVLVQNKSLTVRNIKTKKDTCTIAFFVNEINPQPAKLLRLLLRPQMVPSWISTQSCDIHGDQASQTVKLENFINDVISDQNNPFTVSTFHIFLKQK